MRIDLVCKHQFSPQFEIDIDISCDVGAMALFGPSGSGKTTMLSTIAGTFMPNVGRVVISDQTVFDSELNTWVKPEYRGVGITPQHAMLFDHLTVRKNLEFGMPKHRRWKRRSNHTCQREITFDSVVEVLELGNLLNRYPGTLSGGERQRIAVGRALLSQPRLLILDEPLSALDQSLKEKVLDYLKRVITHWHLPTIIITHSQRVVYELADSVVMIDDGHVISVGCPESVLPRPMKLHRVGRGHYIA